MTNPGFNPRLESLRGIAALVVVLYHVSMVPWGSFHTLPWPRSDTLQAVFNGQAAVFLFFVLSGFVLGASIERGPGAILPAVSRFLTARILRIYPAVIVTVALYATVFALLPSSNFDGASTAAPNLLSNMLMLKIDLNVVMWSLQLEVIAIPLVLAVGLAGRRFGVAAPIIASFIMGALSFHGGWLRLAPLLPLGALMGFTFGMAACYSRGLVERIPSSVQSIIMLIGVAMLIAPHSIIPASTSGYRWMVLTETIGATVIVAVVAFGRAVAFLEWPVARFYGKISYSLYLLHPLALIVLWQAGLFSALPPAAAFLLNGLAAVVLTTPLAWLCWRFIEVPGIEFGRRRQTLAAA